MEAGLRYGLPSSFSFYNYLLRFLNNSSNKTHKVQIQIVSCSKRLHICIEFLILYS